MRKYFNNSQFKRKFISIQSPEKSVLSCAACRIYIASLLNDRRNGATAEELSNSAFGMCRIVTDYSEEMCRGIVNLNTDPMIFIIDARPTLTANQMCSIVLQGECGAVDPQFLFTVNVSPGPPITQPKSIPTPRAPNDLRIVHITDMHFDENYQEGNTAICSNSVCCRRNDGPAGSPAEAAGFWGAFTVIWK